MVTDDEIDKIIDYLNKIGNSVRSVGNRMLSVSDIAKIRSKTGEFGQKYDAKLILADVCLAWRNQYKKKVIPRVLSIKERYSSIKTLEQLQGTMESLGDRFNKEFWDFNSPRRKQMFSDLIAEFIQYKGKMLIENDLEAMRHWARNAVLEDYKKGINGKPVTCLGIANYQYLRMLCGINTVKPDTHILRGVKDALGYETRPFQVVKLIEITSHHMGTSALEIDQLLWVYYTDEVPEIGWNE